MNRLPRGVGHRQPAPRAPKGGAGRKEPLTLDRSTTATATAVATTTAPRPPRPMPRSRTHRQARFSWTGCRDNAAPRPCCPRPARRRHPLDPPLPPHPLHPSPAPSPGSGHSRRPWRLLPTPTGTPFTFGYAVVLTVTAMVTDDADPSRPTPCSRGPAPMSRTSYANRCWCCWPARCGWRAGSPRRTPSGSCWC